MWLLFCIADNDAQASILDLCGNLDRQDNSSVRQSPCFNKLGRALAKSLA